MQKVELKNKMILVTGAAGFIGANLAMELLVSELINTGYMELRSLVVGLKYSSGDLAFYNRGKSFPQLFASNINTALQSVLFPMMANIQEDSKSLGKMMRRVIRVNSFLITPMVVGLALVAKPFISVLLTDKWLECVPNLQLYCLFYCFVPIQSANIQAIKAIGRSDLYLKQEIVKKMVGLGTLLVALPLGPLAIAMSAVLSNIIACLISAVPAKKYFGYSLGQQMRDLLSGIAPPFCNVWSCFGTSLFTSIRACYADFANRDRSACLCFGGISDEKRVFPLHL